MQVIGFNFKKISASREKEMSKPDVDIHLEFIEIEKTQLDLLKDTEASSLNFKHTITYSQPKEKEGEKEKKGEIIFEGNVILALTKEESKEVHKSWSSKKLMPKEFEIPLYNLILRKCMPKAVQMADEISLPSPILMPKIKSNPN